MIYGAWRKHNTDPKWLNINKTATMTGNEPTQAEQALQVRFPPADEETICWYAD